MTRASPARQTNSPTVSLEGVSGAGDCFDAGLAGAREPELLADPADQNLQVRWGGAILAPGMLMAPGMLNESVVGDGPPLVRGEDVEDPKLERRQANGLTILTHLQ